MKFIIMAFLLFLGSACAVASKDSMKNDIAKRLVHLGTQSEVDWMMKRPLVFRQKDRALEKAKEESLRQLEKRLSMQLGQIKVGKF